MMTALDAVLQYGMLSAQTVAIISPFLTIMTAAYDVKQRLCITGMAEKHGMSFYGGQSSYSDSVRPLCFVYFYFVYFYLFICLFIYSCFIALPTITVLC